MFTFRYPMIPFHLVYILQEVLVFQCWYESVSFMSSYWLIFELSCWILWGDNFWIFYTKIILPRCFTWNHPSMVFLFYMNTHSFPELCVYRVFMGILIYVTFCFVSNKSFPRFLFIECQFLIEVYLIVQFMFIIIKFWLILSYYQNRFGYLYQI